MKGNAAPEPTISAGHPTELEHGTEASSPEPATLSATPRRIALGTVTTGLLGLLALVVIAAAVLPTPRLELWLLAVIAVLGLSLMLLVLALLPRPVDHVTGGDGAREER